MPNTSISEPDIVLIGAGIMSATLGVFLKELEPSFSIEMLETLEGAGLKSSDSWNNAGTGHAANCELNYTPERADGSIDIPKRYRSTSSLTCRANFGPTLSRRDRSKTRGLSFTRFRT
jgi:L-2-hydroxyglutarate oxidase LhgO